MTGDNGTQREDPISALRRAATRLGTLDADRAVLEQAKGALMLRYGVGSHVAFALLLRWSHELGTDPDAIAHTLVHGICRGAPTESREPAVVQWLEEQLRRDLQDDHLALLQAHGPDSPAGPRSH